MSQDLFGDDLRELYQQLILDHNQNPRNFHEMDHPSHKANGHNPLCGDQINVFLQIEDGIIRDISFIGSGCAISKASSSIMTENLKGKTIEVAQATFESFHHMIMTGENDPEEMGKLAVLAGVHKFPTRVKCAILPWHTVKNALEGKVATTTTE